MLLVIGVAVFCRRSFYFFFYRKNTNIELAAMIFNVLLLSGKHLFPTSATCIPIVFVKIPEKKTRDVW